SLRNPVKRKREHAKKFMRYQNKRGGKVKLQSNLMPSSEFDQAEKGDALYAMELALSLEKLTNKKLLHVHAVANKNNDVQLANFFKASSWANSGDDTTKVNSAVKAWINDASSRKHVLKFTAKLVDTPKYATSTEQTYSVTVNKGDDVGNHIEQKPCRKDKSVIQSQKNCQCLNHILWRKKFKIKVLLMDYTGGYGTMYKAWRKEDGITFDVKCKELHILEIQTHFRVCSGLLIQVLYLLVCKADRQFEVETAKYVENLVQNNVGAKMMFGKDWSATSIDWEISDNDEENYERMTMQAASGATECESKGEHDGKIFDMTLDTSLASPAIPVKNGMVSQMILQAAAHTSSMSMTSTPGLLYVD
nr:ferritin-2, chloroplastic [Tanacetum cinerariifolium]